MFLHLQFTKNKKGYRIKIESEREVVNRDYQSRLRAGVKTSHAEHGLMRITSHSRTLDQSNISILALGYSMVIRNTNPQHTIRVSKRCGRVSTLRRKERAHGPIGAKQKTAYGRVRRSAGGGQHPLPITLHPLSEACYDD